MGHPVVRQGLDRFANVLLSLQRRQRNDDVGHADPSERITLAARPDLRRSAVATPCHATRLSLRT